MRGKGSQRWSSPDPQQGLACVCPEAMLNDILSLGPRPPAHSLAEVETPSMLVRQPVTDLVGL